MASPSLPVTSSLPQSAESNSMTSRYLDAYRHTKFLIALGSTIKSASLIAGSIVAFLSLIYMVSNLEGLGGALGLMGLIAGAMLGGIGWVMGTLVAAQGQLITATLDAAVNSSPF